MEGSPVSALACPALPATLLSPSFCCLASSDVWARREVPEWALGIAHSLPVPPALTQM